MNNKGIFEKIINELYQPLWGKWYIKEYIDSGAKSEVYKIAANRGQRIDECALKIEIITAEDHLFFDDKEKQAYLERELEMFNNETNIMLKLHNSPYVVRYYD